MQSSTMYFHTMNNHCRIIVWLQNDLGSFCCYCSFHIIWNLYQLSFFRTCLFSDTLSQSGLAAITKIPQTRQFRQQKFISHSLEAEKFKIKALADSVSSEGPLSSSLIVFTMSSHAGWGQDGLFYKGGNYVMT